MTKPAPKTQQANQVLQNKKGDNVEKPKRTVRKSRRAVEADRGAKENQRKGNRTAAKSVREIVAGGKICLATKRSDAIGCAQQNRGEELREPGNTNEAVLDVIDAEQSEMALQANDGNSTHARLISHEPDCGTVEAHIPRAAVVADKVACQVEQEQQNVQVTHAASVIRQPQRASRIVGLGALAKSVEKQTAAIQENSKLLSQIDVLLRQRTEQDSREISEMLKRAATDRRESEERNRKRHDEVLKALREVSKVENPDDNSGKVLLNKAEVAKEYVRYVVSTAFLDPDGGKLIFSANTPIDADDSRLIREAARFAFPSDTTDEKIDDFLNSSMPKKSVSSRSERVGSFISLGMSRTHESIRNTVVLAYFDLSPRSDENLAKVRAIPKDPKKNPKTSDELRPARQAAKLLCIDRQLLELSSFDEAWKGSIDVAAREALSISISAKGNLTRMVGRDAVSELVRLYKEFPCLSSGYKVSIFTIGFVVMKVLKDIEKRARMNIRCQKVTHQPFWASETLKLNKNVETVSDLSRAREDSESEVEHHVLLWKNIEISRCLKDCEIQCLEAWASF